MFHRFKKTNIYVIWTVLSLIYFFFFATFIRFDDRVVTNGDDHGYQMVAVNYAEGKGMMAYGIYGDPSRYKMDFTNNEKELKNNLKTELSYNFYNTPGYPVFFLGNFYKFFGVSPLLAKYFSLFILCVVAGGLCFLCFNVWGEDGVIVGLISSLLQIFFSYHLSYRILTEPFIIFSLFLITLCLISFVRKSTIFNSILLGLSLALGVLVKGSLIFYPFIVFSLALYFLYKKKLRLAPLIVLIGVFFSIMSSWSVYATKHSPQMVLLSTQGSAVLLDGNNEYTQGGWEPRWAEHKDSFYNRDNMQQHGALVRVANFYIHHPLLFPVLMLKKLVIGFCTQLFFCLIFIAWFFVGLSRYLKNRKQIRALNYMFAGIIISFSIFHIYTLQTSSLLWEVYYFILTNKIMLFVLATLLVAYVVFVRKHIARFITGIPIFVSVGFLNFLLLTLMLFGEMRFVNVMNFLLIIYFVRFIQDYIFELKSNQQSLQ